MGVHENRILKWVKQAIDELRNAPSISLNLIFYRKNGRVMVDGTIGKPCGRANVDDNLTQ